MTMDETWTTTEAALKARGVALMEESGSELPIVLSGKTFEIRQHIKAVGGRWSKSEQAWRLGSKDEAARLAELLESGAPPPAAPAGLAEAAGSFAGYGTKHYHGHRDRLRQRFIEGGPQSLPDYELLELLLFFSVWRRDTKPAAKELLKRFGSLGGVLAADPARYAEAIVPAGEIGAERYADDIRFTGVLFKAVREIMARVLKEDIAERPVLTSWTALIDYLSAVMMHDAAEHFRVLFLDRKNILIRDEVQSRGTVDHTPLYPREVVKRALELQASAVIMVHNHPSGDPTPSRADIEMTEQVVNALKAVGITVHDHVIIGRHKHTSFRALQLM